MNGKQLLTRAIQAVTFLFAMFSGFLTSIAPPEEANSKFAVGICSFLTLVILLFISVFAQKPLAKRNRKVWLSIAILFFLATIVSAFLYKGNLDRLTFAYPLRNTVAEYVAGTEFTPAAKIAREENPGETVSQFVAGFGGPSNRELIWTPESIRHASMMLLINYTVLVLSLAITMFCLTEGLLTPTPAKQKTRRVNSRRWKRKREQADPADDKK